MNIVIASRLVKPFNLEYLLTGYLENSKDQDEMLHNAAFNQGLHCFQR